MYRVCSFGRGVTEWTTTNPARAASIARAILAAHPHMCVLIVSDATGDDALFLTRSTIRRRRGSAPATAWETAQ